MQTSMLLLYYKNNPKSSQMLRQSLNQLRRISRKKVNMFYDEIIIVIRRYRPVISLFGIAILAALVYIFRYQVAYIMQYCAYCMILISAISLMVGYRGADRLFGASIALIVVSALLQSI